LLSSLRNFIERGGKIFLVDTGSTDNTVQVAKDAGVVVDEVGSRFIHTITADQAKAINDFFVEEGEDSVVQANDTVFNYSAARNYASTLAEQDMIAMPDCDEVYTSLDIDAINKEIQGGAEQFEYNFVFAHDSEGKPVVEFLHSKFYNRTKLKWVRIIHEVLDGEAKRIHLPEEVIKLEHYQNEKTNRSHYLKGLALDCYEDRTSDRNSHYFGRELLWTKRPKSAIKELKRHIAMNKWQTEQAQSMIFIGDAYAQLDDREEAKTWYNKSFDLHPYRREALLKLADLAFQKAENQKVVSYVKAAMEIPKSNYYADNATHYTYYPHFLLYISYWWLNRKEESAKHWETAYEFEPYMSRHLHDARFYIDLPTVDFIIPTLGRPDGLQKCIDSIKALNYPQEKLVIHTIEDNPRLGVPKRVAQGVSETKGDYICFASNDVEFTPDSLIIAVLKSMVEKKRLVAFNTGELLSDEGNINEHFIIKRSLVEEIGEIFDTDFHHVGVDNLLWAKCGKINEAVRADRAIVKHNHFSKGAEMDEVYQLGWEKVEEDRQLLKAKLAKL
jgi:glycosyltransferase involved in cell wall biosynthesis